MNTPQKPKDPPTEGAPLDADPTGTMSHGIPDGMESEDATATATPTSDRQATETRPKK